MLIQNNSNTILTKYVSIYLKETYNSDIEVNSVYNNSKYNYYKENDGVLFSGYVNVNNEYAYIIGESGIVGNMPDGILIPYLPNNIRADSVITFNKEITAIKSDVNGNLIITNDVYDTITIDTESMIFVNIKESNSRPINDLCSYIYLWLKDRYRNLLPTDSIYTNMDIINGNVSTYFITGNTLYSVFNNVKLPYDIDEFVYSFLLNRPISNLSTNEEIEYAQNLLKNNKYLKQIPNLTFSDYVKVPGMWDKLHELIYIYQINLNERYKMNNDNTNNADTNNFKIVIPTGYLDIITERYLLLECEGDDIGYNSTNSKHLCTI